MGIPIFEKFCGVNFYECLSLKNFAGLIFVRRGEIRKIGIAKIYAARFYPALINPHKVVMSIW